MKRTILLPITIFLLCVLKLDAQTWQNITYSPTGLPSNKVNTVCSDAAGNYWIATEDSGMTRLNNNQHTKWTDRDRITTNSSRVVKAQNEVLYLKSNYDSKYFGIVKYDSIFRWIKSPFNFRVEPYCSDKNGNIWCRNYESGSGGGAVRYNPSDNSWAYFNISNSGIKSNSISDITADSFGNVWFGHGTDFHVSKFDGVNWRWYRLHPNYATNASLLKADKLGNIYFSGITELYKYNKITDTILPVSSPQTGVYGGNIGIDEANNVLTVKDNQTFPSSTSVFKLSPSGVWSSRDIQGIGINPNTIDVFNPNEFWVTTYGGIYRLRDSSYSLFNKSNSGIEDYTLQILKGRKPNEIIVRHFYELSFLDTILKTSKILSQYNSGLYENNVEDIFVDSRGNKWINHHYGVQKLGPDNKTWDFYDDDSLLYIDEKLKNREDNYGNIWFFDGNGISKISPTGAITNTSVEQIVGPEGGTINYLTIHPNGDIWTTINTQSSTVIKKLSGNTWVSITYPFPGIYPFPNGSSCQIVADKNSNIWFSNRYYNTITTIYFGLVKFNTNTNLWDTINPPAAYIYANKLFSDRFGKIWVTYSDSGAACYDGQQWTRYHKGNSNILSNNINDIYVDTFGKVWFSTNLGISVLTPAPATAPNVTTAAAINITTNAAQVSGTIVSNGGSSITAKGICWSITPNPTVNNSKSTETTANLTYTSSLSGLSAGTKYYARAYATNAIGTAYGNEISFTTLSNIILTTTAISNISSSTATSGGNISSDGTITSRGVCWSTSANPTTSSSKTTDGSGPGSFTSTITNLQPNTTYYVKAYATNAIGTAYGNEISFTTTGLNPGCVNTLLWPNAEVTVPQSAGQTIEITPGNGELDCNFAGEYSRTQGWKDGLKYTIYSTRATDFITITDDNNVVIKSGVQPLEFTNAGTSVKRIHVNLNSSCATEDACRDISIKLNASTGLSNYTLLNDVQLFPNPNQGSMFIESVGINFKTEKFDLKLYNMLGQEVQMSFEFINENKIRLIALNVNDGLFWMKLFIGDKEIRKTVQISK
jgi:streptogramin lyase